MNDNKQIKVASLHQTMAVNCRCRHWIQQIVGLESCIAVAPWGVVDVDKNYHIDDREIEEVVSD